MFSLKRDVHYSINHVVGIDDQGERHVIPYKLLGTGGFNQVRRQVNKRCKQGKASKIARASVKRIVQQAEAPYKDLVRIEVLNSTFHLDSFFLINDLLPVATEVLASEDVDRQNVEL